MYTLLRASKSRGTLAREGAALTAALIVADTSFHFHSFARECLAFLGTWTLLSVTFDLAVNGVAHLVRSRENPVLAGMPGGRAARTKSRRAP